MDYLILNASGGSMTGALLEGVKTDMLSEVNIALPIAGGVFAVIAGIMIGFKIFKKITGARA